MSLTNKIIFKTFIWSLTAMVTLSTLIPVSIFFLLPANYESYVRNQLVQYSQGLVYQIQNVESTSDIEFLIEYYYEQYGISTELYQNGELIMATSDIELIHKNKFDLTDVEKIARLEMKSMKDTEITETQIFDINYSPYVLKTHKRMSNVVDVQNSLLSLLVPILLMITVFSLIISVFLARKLTKPVEKIKKKTLEISKLNFQNGIVINSGDEFEDISQLLDKMSVRLQVTISKLEKDMNSAKAREEERRRLVASLSHDLKTPITVLKLQTEMMLDNVGKYQDRDKYLKENVEKINRIEKMIDEILFTSKLDDDNFELVLSKININDLIIPLVEEAKIAFELDANAIKLNNKDIDKKATVMANYELLQRSVNNLIINAVKYKDEGTSIRIIVTDKSIQVINFCSAYKDHNSDINDLFKAFYRGESSRNAQTGGSGLGLYIVKKTCDLHGFEINASASGGLVTFEIKFQKEEE